MQVYKENDKSKAICEKCVKVVDTTFVFRDVKKPKSGEKVNILVAVCDECGEIVAIPAQSLRALYEDRNT